jgi:hypothetical protein
MMDLPEPWNWVTMLLVAAALGAFGGLAYELLHRGRGTNEHLGWVGSPVVGAATALAVLYFFPPHIPTVTVDENGVSTTTYAYDLVKLVALSLIAGSAGGSFLSAMQARLLTQVKEQELQHTKTVATSTIPETVERAQETTMNQLQTTLEQEARPMIEEHLKQAAKAIPQSVVDELMRHNVPPTAIQAITAAHPVVNTEQDVSNRIEIIESKLDKIPEEVSQTAQGDINEQMKTSQAKVAAA